nr:guanylate cyclase activator 2B [Vulpes vulpes]
MACKCHQSKTGRVRVARAAAGIAVNKLKVQRKGRRRRRAVKHQGFQVQLESVKRLSDLQGTWVPSPRLQTQNLVPPECHHPALPTDLQPICTTREAASIFKALKAIASDDCELCVNVACTGCL